MIAFYFISISARFRLLIICERKKLVCHLYSEILTMAEIFLSQYEFQYNSKF